MLLRLPESQLNTLLLKRVDKLKKWTDFRDEVAAISRAIAVAQSQPTPMEVGAVGKGGNQARVARDRKELANVTIRLSKHVPGAETLITLLQTVLTLTKRAENVGRLVIWHVRVEECECCQNVLELVRVDTSSQCPKKKVHAVEESSTTASQVGSQDTIVVGSIGSYFDVGSVSEATLEPRGEDEKIC